MSEVQHYQEFASGAAAFGLHIRKEHIVLLQAIIESYDHLGLVRTIAARAEGGPTRIAILTTSGRAEVVKDLLQSIREEIFWNPADISDVSVGVLFAAGDSA